MSTTISADKTNNKVAGASIKRALQFRARFQLARIAPTGGYGEHAGTSEQPVRDAVGQLTSTMTFGSNVLPLFDIDTTVVRDGHLLTFADVTPGRRDRNRLKRKLRSTCFATVDGDLDPNWAAGFNGPSAGSHNHSATARAATPLVLALHDGFELIPSRTAGHFHLYSSQPVTYRTYAKTLTALARAGVVDADWAQVTRSRRLGVLLIPGMGPVKPAP